MGIAMFLVLAFHYSLHYGMMDSPLVVRGDIGVDLFIFLSGFGCFYSLSKKNWLQFYKARIKRIYPTFILVIILTLITNGILFKEWPNAHQCVISLSGFSYFINGNLETWYISAILILYCISPLLFHYSKLKFLIWICILPYAIPVITFPMGCNWLDIMSFRIPSFIWGFIVGKISCSREVVINKKIILTILFMVVIGGVCLLMYYTFKSMQHNHLRYNIYPALTLAILFICRKLPKSTVLDFLGKYSLEIYLVHQPILKYFDFIKNIPLFLLTTTISLCIISVLIHKTIINLLPKAICNIK